MAKEKFLRLKHGASVPVVCIHAFSFLPAVPLVQQVLLVFGTAQPAEPF